jgi:TRAP transporter TAXI family solute receptor
MSCVSRRFVAIALATVFASASAIAAEGVLTVLTGNGSSVYYTLGLALSKSIGKALPGVKASAQTTKGSAENLSLLQAGRGDIALTLGDSLSDAWSGREAAGFKVPMKSLRGIAAIYPSYIQIVARADSDIGSLADLKGKRISVGAVRSATELNARVILAAAGLSYKDFAKVEHFPYGQSAELMKERQIDATLQTAAAGASSLRDLANALPVVIVPIPPDVIAKINDPVYLSGTIPANTYRGQTADAPTVAVQNYLVTHEGVSSETVYAMTKALWTNLDQLIAAHPAAKAIDPKRALDGMPLPLHPGAERYYKEVGIIQ